MIGSSVQCTRLGKETTEVSGGLPSAIATICDALA